MYCRWAIATVTGLIIFATQAESFSLASRYKPQQPNSFQEQKRIQLAEKAVDQFIQRWHDTLDFNTLFDEMYVSSAEQRQRNTYLFFELYRCMASLGFTPGFQEDVDELLIKRAFVAMQNALFLRHEYMLAFTSLDGSDSHPPVEIAKVGEVFIQIELDGPQKGRLTKPQIEEFIRKADYISAVYRRLLSKGVFNSPHYKTNLSTLLKETHSTEILNGWSSFGIKKGTEIYEIGWGAFKFYFINEQSILRLLTVIFDC